jgi:ribosome maturation factor RimP
VIENQISEIVSTKLLEPGFEDYFLLEVKIQGKKVEVIIDSDSGVTFEKCRMVSRNLETILDEQNTFVNDYVLEVSSPGITRPITLHRQYLKNINRILTITTKDKEIYEGIMSEVNDVSVVITFETKRKEGKKNIKETVNKEISISDIDKAIVKISF